MKKVNALFEPFFFSPEWLIIADIDTRININPCMSMRRFDENWWSNIEKLHKSILEGSYTHGSYRQFDRRGADGKKRHISVCCYRDRIVHTALVLMLQDIIMKRLTADCYGSLPGRGPHRAIRRIRKIMKNHPEDLFAYSGDIKDCYNSINGEILLNCFKRFIKDERVLNLIYQVILSRDGLSIGSRTSPWFQNVYLNEIDHLMKKWGVKYYFRYSDNFLILDSDETFVKTISEKLEKYLQNERKLTLHEGKIFKIGESKGYGRGLDFIGYEFFRKHTFLRHKTRMRLEKSIRNRSKSEPDKHLDDAVKGSMKGLLKHCNSKNLYKKLRNEYPNYFERLLRLKAA